VGVNDLYQTLEILNGAEELRESWFAVPKPQRALKNQDRRQNAFGSAAKNRGAFLLSAVRIGPHVQHALWKWPATAVDPERKLNGWQS